MAAFVTVEHRTLFSVKRQFSINSYGKNSKNRRLKMINESRHEKRLAIANKNRHIEWNCNYDEDWEDNRLSNKMLAKTPQTNIINGLLNCDQDDLMNNIQIAKKWMDLVGPDRQQFMADERIVQTLIGHLACPLPNVVKIEILDILIEIGSLMGLSETVWGDYDFPKILLSELTNLDIVYLTKVLDTILIFSSISLDFDDNIITEDYINFLVNMVITNDLPILRKSKIHKNTDINIRSFNEKLRFIKSLSKCIIGLPWHKFGINLIDTLIPALKKLIGYKDNAIFYDVVTAISSFTEYHGESFVNLIIKHDFVVEVIDSLTTNDLNLLPQIIGLISKLFTLSQQFVKMSIEYNVLTKFQLLFNIDKEQIIKGLIGVINTLIGNLNMNVKLLIDSGIMNGILRTFASNNSSNILKRETLDLITLIINHSSKFEMINLIEIGIIESLFLYFITFTDSILDILICVFDVVRYDNASLEKFLLKFGYPHTDHLAKYDSLNEYPFNQLKYQIFRQNLVQLGTSAQASAIFKPLEPQFVINN